MLNTINIRIPNKIKYFKIIENSLKQIVKNLNFSKKEIKQLIIALKELVENAIIHAYKENEGFIEIEFHIFLYGVRIDVKDWGLPVSQTKQTKRKNPKGLKKVERFVDSLEFKNLGKEGKRFSIIKYSSKPIKYKEEKQKKENLKIIPEKIMIRRFKKGDEEQISKLIYENYGFTYAKELFYYPDKIKEHENKKIFSVIAQYKKEIVGHFALIKNDDSNIAEVGIVVVSPKFKGLGIMDKMFDKLIEVAKEIGFYAIYGEAIMYHEFSQKSNLKHNFVETALEIGKTLKNVQINDNNLTNIEKRGATLVGYKLLKSQQKKIFIPQQYYKKIVEIYNSCKKIKYTIQPTTNQISRFSLIKYQYDPLKNIGTIVIDRYGKDFIYKFNIILNYLQTKHCDMIYVDVNLEKISNIDEVVKILNKFLFFFSGVLFLYHLDNDYLRLQKKHSLDIGKHNIKCYSNFSKELFLYIQNDEKRLYRLTKAK